LERSDDLADDVADGADTTGRIDLVTTDLANRRSTYFFFKARTDGGRFLDCWSRFNETV
jgi:hypothetical protein